MPVDDPFWNEHHPGDRWNCKCSLEATDEPVNRPADLEPATPQRGLENNPGKDGHTFSDRHPYFPSDCSHCFAYRKSGMTNRLKALFINRGKDCYNCPYIDGCLSRMSNNGFKLEKSFSNGGKLYVHPDVDVDKDDYKAMKRICLEFAKLGNEVKMIPRLHFKSDDYQRIYGSLEGTKYYKKCPDFSVNGVFYEYEGYVKPWNKKKIGRMLSHGMVQSEHLIINNTKGCSDRFIRKQIVARQ
ncbi:MAG: phage head morphogenesis protein [Prevotella sp.]|nr:phage head morphogenesis protein [Prevotella sp.]